MMVALLLYAYSRGVYSSRRIAQGCEERVDFMAVTAMNQPDFRTIANFRRRHLKALSDLFVQVLKLCRAAGLVKLGHVALDGTKVQANASVHKAMSYGRMPETEKRLSTEVSAWFACAEATDAEEERAHGSDRRGGATRCRIGWPTRRHGSSASAPPRRHWRPNLRNHRRRTTMDQVLATLVVDFGRHDSERMISDQSANL